LDDLDVLDVERLDILGTRPEDHAIDNVERARRATEDRGRRTHLNVDPFARLATGTNDAHTGDLTLQRGERGRCGGNGRKVLTAELAHHEGELDPLDRVDHAGDDQLIEPERIRLHRDVHRDRG